MLLGRNHFFGFFRCDLVDRQGRRHGRHQKLLQPSASRVVPTGQQRLAQQGQTEEPTEGLHHDIGRDHVFLQVVQERVRGLTELGRCLVSLGEDTVIATGYLANLVLWFQEDWAMGDRMRNKQFPLLF